VISPILLQTLDPSQRAGPRVNLFYAPTNRESYPFWQQATRMLVVVVVIAFVVPILGLLLAPNQEAKHPRRQRCPSASAFPLDPRTITVPAGLITTTTTITDGN